MWEWNLDSFFDKAFHDAFAHLTGDLPLLHRLADAEHSERYCRIVERVDSQDLRGVDYQQAEIRVVRQILADAVQHADHMIGFFLVRHTDVQQHPRPVLREVGRRRDRAVRDHVDLALKVTQYRSSQIDRLDQPCDTGDFDNIPLPVLVLGDDQDPSYQVPNEVLGAEPNRYTRDS